MVRQALGFNGFHQLSLLLIIKIRSGLRGIDIDVFYCQLKDALITIISYDNLSATVLDMSLLFDLNLLASYILKVI